MERILESKLFLLFKKGFIYLVVIYVLIMLGRSIWVNWSLKNEVDHMKNDIIELELENKNLENLIVYYQSDSFKELEARDVLGLQLPDEKVVIVPVKKFNDYQAKTNQEREILNIKKEVTPNWLAWWRYIFE